jgi:cell division protein FtsL
MTKLNLLLLAAIVATAFQLIKSSHDARRNYAELDRLQNEQRQLDTDYRRLLTERQAQATNLRVERVAREKLQMRPATPAVTVYVSDAPASSAESK